MLGNVGYPVINIGVGQKTHVSRARAWVGRLWVKLRAVLMEVNLLKSKGDSRTGGAISGHETFSRHPKDLFIKLNRLED